MSEHTLYSAHVSRVPKAPMPDSRSLFAAFSMSLAPWRSPSGSGRWMSCCDGSRCPQKAFAAPQSAVQWRKSGLRSCFQ